MENPQSHMEKVNKCSSNPCLNGATCTDQVNGSSCTCPKGYSGTRCENNIDECSSNPCQNGGICTDQVNGYSCTCAAGYSGTRCENNIDECSSNPCQNGGTCTDQVNGYSCTCAAGFNGARCENRGIVGTKIHFPYRSSISIFVYRVVQGSVSGIQKAFDNHNHDTIAKGEEFTVLVNFSSSLYNNQRQWYEISARFCYGKDIERCVNQKRPFSHPYLVRPSSVQIPVPFVIPFSKIHKASLPDGSTVNEAGIVHEQFKTFLVNGAKYDTSTGVLERFVPQSPEKAGKISGIDFLRDTRRALKHQPLVQCYFVEWTTDGCVPGLDNLMNGYDVKYLELKNRPWLKVKFPEHRDERYLQTLRIPGKGTFNYLVLKDMVLKAEATMANPFSYVFASVKEQVEEVLKFVGLELKKGYFLGSGKYQSYIKRYKKQAFSAAMSGTEFRFFRATIPTSHLRDDANWDDGFNAKWKSLFKHRNNATAIDFFREYGTHYIVNAVMGGRQETLFTLNYCLLIKYKGKILDFKARLIKPYKFSSSSVGVQAYYNYLKSHSLSKMIISGPETTCTGGDSLDSEVCHNLTLWKDSLFNNPYPIRMTLKPFYTLVQGDDDSENRKWMKEMYQEYLKADLDEVEINKDITVKVKCEGREYRVRGALSVVIAGIVILELWF